MNTVYNNWSQFQAERLPPKTKHFSKNYNKLMYWESMRKLNPASEFFVGGGSDRSTT